MIQALHAILGDGPKEQQSATEEVTLLYGSRNSDDILGGEMLQHWASTHSNKFNYIDVLSNEPTELKYNGERGFIDKEKIVKYLPPPSDDDVIIFICGPPIMYDSLKIGGQTAPQLHIVYTKVKISKLICGYLAELKSSAPQSHHNFSQRLFHHDAEPSIFYYASSITTMVSITSIQYHNENLLLQYIRKYEYYH